MNTEKLLDLLVGDQGDRDACAQIIATSEELLHIWERDGADAAPCLRGIFEELLCARATP